MSMCWRKLARQDHLIGANQCPRSFEVRAWCWIPHHQITAFSERDVDKPARYVEASLGFFVCPVCWYELWARFGPQNGYLAWHPAGRKIEIGSRLVQIV
jgi:hypothetical protein